MATESTVFLPGDPMDRGACGLHRVTKESDMTEYISVPNYQLKIIVTH